MNRTLTSREAILTASREIAMQSGLPSLNMRDVARRCGVAVGSVYNYFPSKGDLLIAAVGSIWTEILHGHGDCLPQEDFCGAVRALFEKVRAGSRRYPSFFTLHAMSLAGVDREKGRAEMNRYFGHIRAGLLETLENDPRVRPDAFSPEVTREALVDFVFSSLLTLLVREEPDCGLLLELLRRALY